MFEGLLLPLQQILPSWFSIEFSEQFLKFLVNFTLLKYVKSQRSYGFLITKELFFGFQSLDLKDHFSASLSYNIVRFVEYYICYMFNNSPQVCAHTHRAQFLSVPKWPLSVDVLLNINEVHALIKGTFTGCVSSPVPLS